MRNEKFAFTVNNFDYILWIWRGNYLNLGAGAEMGLYYRPTILPSDPDGLDHYFAHSEIVLPMDMYLYNCKESENIIMSNYLSNLNKEREKGDKITQCFAATYILQREIYGENSISVEMNEVVNQMYEQTKLEQGALLIFLYALLVIPKELIDIGKYKEKYKDINTWMEQNGIAEEQYSDYKNEKNHINYVRHMRNAISHGKVEFEEYKYITFKDNTSDNLHRCQFKIAMGKNISDTINKLREVIADYNNNVYRYCFTANNNETT